MKISLTLLVLLMLSACNPNKFPLVTLYQLDTKNQVVNPFKVTKYNKETCKMEVDTQASFPTGGPELHGAFCLTAEEFSKVKAKVQADCLNNKNKNQNNTEY